MPRITRREAAMALAMQSPDGALPAPAKPRAPMRHPEADLQRACIAWLRIRQRIHKDVRFIVAQSENMGKPTPQRQARRIAMGIAHNAGHPEIMLIFSSGRVVFVELKASDGRMSAEQIDWQLWMLQRGFDYRVIRSVDELVGLFG